MYILKYVLTDSCPGSSWGASLRPLGLDGDKTDIEGLSIFCDSKELEPAAEGQEKTSV